MIDKKVIEKFQHNQTKIIKQKNWKGFQNAHTNLIKNSHSALPFDHKFNAVSWAFDCAHLLGEIAYSYCWMISYAGYYKENIPKNSLPSHTDFFVSYYANNAITRINSCRDKIALMIWAFYCPFNPEKKEEVLIFHKVLEKLKHPEKYCLNIKNHEVFVGHLEKLIDDDFKDLGNLRHSIIHRREPKIEIFGCKDFQGWGYLLPLVTKDEIDSFEKDLEKQYPDAGLRKSVKQNCYINGFLYDRVKLKKHHVNYDDIQSLINSCMGKLLDSTAASINVINSRAPLRKRK